MKSAPTYHVMLLPTLEILVTGYTLREAAAWIEVYNFILQEEAHEAVIGEEARPDRQEHTISRSEEKKG